MICQSHSCGPLESCSVEDGTRGCRPNRYASCWIWGPGTHIWWADYQYPGACRLTLAKVMGSSNHLYFVVTAEKVPRNQQDFAQLLNFEAEGAHVTTEMANSSRVEVEKNSSILYIWYLYNLKVRHLNIDPDKWQTYSLQQIGPPLQTCCSFYSSFSNIGNMRISFCLL